MTLPLWCIKPSNDTAEEHRRREADVYALFHAALGQQLQGAPGARPTRNSLPPHRDRYPQRREPHAGVPGIESAWPGAAARSRARPLPCRIERDPMALGEPNAATTRASNRSRRSAAMDVL